MSEKTLIDSNLFQSVAELQEWTDELKSEMNDQQIILLEGPMGVGKTQFTRCYLRSLNSDEVTSPSYAIHNHYETEWGDVEHLDLYRLEDEEDLESTGFWDLFSRDKSLIIIEWADRLDFTALPKTWSLWLVQMRFRNEYREINRSIIR
jgi:tRNA threonylcarbamoyladenosine biosynthesis protein TsaE